MAIEIKIIGEEGHRQVVKTIDIHEDSYELIFEMINSGKCDSEVISEHLIEDVFSILGGNVFSELMHLSLRITIRSILSDLYDAGITIRCSTKDIENEFVETLFPCMCYSGSDALYFISDESEDIQALFEKYIKPEYLMEIKGALYSDFIDGNTAFGLLFFLQTLIKH